MEAIALERVRKGLPQKRDSLTAWLHATPSRKKEILLGPSTVRSVEARLDVINAALLKATRKPSASVTFAMARLTPSSWKLIIRRAYALTISPKKNVVI